MTGENRELITITLAALLHDVGKFYQRTLATEERQSRKHTELGLECFQENFAEKIAVILGNDNTQKIASLINTHHEYADIITLADALSAGMERIELEAEEKGNPSEEYLESVFEKISLGNNIKDCSEYAYHLEHISLEKGEIFPFKIEQKKNLTDDYKNLWNNGFIKDVKNLPVTSPRIYINGLYAILQKYTWCIPSATYKHEPDISLFDHAKTTAAIAGCLYYYKEYTSNKELNINTPAFLLVGGDLSGIQNFIYRIAKTQGAGGISKRLRGRSFYLLLLQEIIAKYIIEEVGLFTPNILFCGGGRFELLLPDTDEVKRILNDAKNDINKWLFKEYGGELGLVIEEVDAKGKELADYSALLEKLDEKISLAKKKRSLTLFQDKCFWIEELSNSDKVKICKVCGINKVSDDNPCELCEEHKNIGARLPHTSYIIYARKEENIEGLHVSFGNFGTVYLIDKNGDAKDVWLKSDNIIDIQKINSVDNLKTSFRFIGNTAPVAKDDFSISEDTEDEDKRVKKGNVLSFEMLAEASIGDKRLGILKMDVDYLGLIFAIGLEDEKERKRKSISRISALSRLMDMFFGGYLNKICDDVFKEWCARSDWEHKEKVEQIFYIVYSGGDDLLIVGPWSEMLKLAEKINDEFKNYTCQNPDINISAGIFLCKPKYPVSLAAKNAGNQLDESKNNGRKRITVFSDTVEWEISKNGPGLNELLTFGEELYDYINSNNGEKLPRSFVHGLIRKYNQYNKGKDPVFIPAIIYQLARNVKDKKLRDELIEKLIKDEFFKYIKIPASYALLKSRKEV